MNKRYPYLYFFTLLYLFILSQNVFSQDLNSNDLKNTVETININHQKQQTEKLFLHIDKPYYMPGDTLWYKAYLLDDALFGSKRSGLLYVELVSDSGKVFKRQIIKVKDGIAFGDFNIKRSFYPGNYTLRAYTNWMRNFGHKSFFQRKVCIVPTGDQYWLIGNQLSADNSKKINLALHFSDLSPKNLGFRDLQLSLLSDNNTLVKQKVTTDPLGNVNFKFDLPQKNSDKQFSLIAEDLSKEGDGRQIIIPVLLNRPENTDLQFMPEGGTLLAGLPARVGFKAIGEDGKGITDLKGVVFDNRMQEVVSFTAAHKGMGTFMFTPQPGNTYTAKLTFNDGSTKSFALPAVKNSGINLQVNNTKGKDSLEVQLSATNDISATSSYLLIGQARDKVFYSVRVSLSNKHSVRKIAKNIFPTGIVKFLLIDQDKRPVTCRMIFIDNNDQLRISINAHKKSYSSKDSVAVQIAVTDATGQPVKGNFSLAVTDDNKIRADDDDAESMITRMLLTADIKGNVEDPGYYFRKENADREDALDNLLLTQGWVGYEWQQKTNQTADKCLFEPELEFRVTGRVSNVFNKPVSNTEIKLQSDYPPFASTTQTDKDGRFVFNDFPNDLEKIDFKLQTTREFNVGVTVDEFVPPEYEVVQQQVKPWYVNSDSTMVSYITDKYKAAVSPPPTKFDLDDMRTRNKLLKEVKIRGKFLRRPPPLRIALDEEDIRNARSGNKALKLMNLLNIKEKINHMYKVLVIDEVPFVPFREITWTDSQLNIDQWLQTYSTEDILDIRVEKMFLNTKLGEIPALVISIHTNGHTGSAMAETGGYFYHPLPISKPHEFYSPRYTVKAGIKDKRSTIHWANNIVTDANGKASLSFFTSDLKGTYTLIMEGSDMNGKVGHQKSQIQIGAN